MDSVQLGDLFHRRPHLLKHLIVLLVRPADPSSSAAPAGTGLACGTFPWGGIEGAPAQLCCHVNTDTATTDDRGLHGIDPGMQKLIATVIFTMSKERCSRSPLDLISSQAIPTPGSCSADLTTSTILGQSAAFGASRTNVPVWVEYPALCSLAPGSTLQSLPNKSTRRAHRSSVPRWPRSLPTSARSAFRCGSSQSDIAATRLLRASSSSADRRFCSSQSPAVLWRSQAIAQAEPTAARRRTESPGNRSPLIWQLPHVLPNHRQPARARVVGPPLIGG